MGVVGGVWRVGHGCDWFGVEGGLWVWLVGCVESGTWV